MCQYRCVVDKVGYWASIRENSSLQVNRVVVFHSGYFSFILNAVHCRERQSENGILKAPSTSANTFWQLEKASDSRSGKYEVSAPHNISFIQGFTLYA